MDGLTEKKIKKLKWQTLMFGKIDKPSSLGRRSNRQMVNIVNGWTGFQLVKIDNGWTDKKRGGWTDRKTDTY